MDAEFFIPRVEREVDHQHNRVILTDRNKVHADGLRRCCMEVAQWANGKETCCCVTSHILTSIIL
jgi:hypothetical protein